MMLFRYICLSGIFLLIAPANSIAQDHRQMLMNEYLKSASSQAVIYNGKEFARYPHTTLNHPYFKEAGFQKGNLSYNGVYYTDIPMKLDINRDELVVLSPDFHSIVLIPENIDSVELHGYRIVYSAKNDAVLLPGYYILLHSGKYPVIGKQTAILDTRVEHMFVKRQFDISVGYYLHKDGKYYRIKNKRSLLNVLNSHKNEISKLIRTKHYSFKTNAEELIVEAVKEYEKIEREP